MYNAHEAIHVCQQFGTVDSMSVKWHRLGQYLYRWLPHRISCECLCKATIAGLCWPRLRGWVSCYLLPMSQRSSVWLKVVIRYEVAPSESVFVFFFIRCKHSSVTYPVYMVIAITDFVLYFWCGGIICTSYFLWLAWRMMVADHLVSVY